MRRGLAFILAAVVGTVLFTLSVPANPPLPSPSVPSPSSPGTTAHPEFGLTGGALPDGTPFLVEVRPALDDDVVGISGAIMLEGQGPVGVLQFAFSSWDGTSYEDGLYRISAGGHFVQIDFYDQILDALGSGAETIIRSSIRGGIAKGYPMLEVEPPFRWATDDELPLQMGVQFKTFEVRRGCSELAVACSPDEIVQVIPVDRLYAPAPVWPGDVEVEVIGG